MLILPPDMEQALPERLLGAAPAAVRSSPPRGGPGRTTICGTTGRGPPALGPLEALLQAGRAGGAGDPGAPADHPGAHL
ncbi:hypothetical protein M5E87_10250 [Flavonifractor plautii]|nr:hypothetical protein M5E87_10250 [Flavonifractor plautii]